MIPHLAITEWGITHPWQTPAQVEQDLLLSRAICEIASHPLLRRELVFRGGTALHKVHLPQPFRYSEDLDYVRSTGGGIGPIFTAIREIGAAMGFATSSLMREHPKVMWRGTDAAGTPLRIKVEINTHERSPAMPTTTVPFQVDSQWWHGSAEVHTFKPPELVATKIRALYQRRKGRDLFDMWLALTRLPLEPEAVLVAFEPYRPHGMTAKSAISNLHDKLADQSFRHDIDLLAATLPPDWIPENAAALIEQTLLEHLDDRR